MRTLWDTKLNEPGYFDKFWKKTKTIYKLKNLKKNLLSNFMIAKTLKK